MPTKRSILIQQRVLGPKLSNEITDNAGFWKLFDALPVEVRDQARAAYLWHADPWHHSLRFKKVEDSIPLYSARVGLGLGYRVVGKREGDTIRWFWIGSHAAYDNVLG